MTQLTQGGEQETGKGETVSEEGCAALGARRVLGETCWVEAGPGHRVM